jgi:class 3 adenylate cyclase
MDVSEALSSIQAPTLVLLNRGTWTPATVGQTREVAVAIKGARLLPIDMSWRGINRDGLDEIVRFLGAEPAPSAPATAPTAFGGVRTILFTDVVGHTEMMRRLGDERGRELLREHERITREVLKQHGGAEVKTMGDGFMASFGSVTKAMDCAIVLQRAFASHTESMPEPLRVRVGLNAGEPIEEDGDLFGSTVILASRICAQAAAGEILIPEPLRHLLSGKSYVYADRGETMLKGFEDAVRLYEVRWRE